MKQESKELIKLTTKEILLSFCDVVIKAQEIFGYHAHRELAKKYWRWRSIDKEQYHQIMYRLRKQGYVKKQGEQDSNKTILTSAGKKRAIKYFFDDLGMPISK